MIVRCSPVADGRPSCGRLYDDAVSWTVCPHGPLWAAPEDYCRYHDLAPCPFDAEGHPCRCSSDDDPECPRHGLRGRPRIGGAAAGPATA